MDPRYLLSPQLGTTSVLESEVSDAKEQYCSEYILEMGIDASSSYMQLPEAAG